jgi:putative transposase
MTLSARRPDGTTQVLVINGRQGRSAKRWRNKQTARLRAKLARCQEGSRRHRKLTVAKKKPHATTDRRLRDVDHQVTARAEKITRDVHAAWTGHHQAEAVVVGDARGIEQHTTKQRRASRSTRQQLSQWSRGRQEQQLAYKTGLAVEHVGEAYSSQTCPTCLHWCKPRRREYVCKNPECGFRGTGTRWAVSTSGRSPSTTGPSSPCPTSLSRSCIADPGRLDPVPAVASRVAPGNPGALRRWPRVS